MKRTEWLDSWRGIGCLMVFASHALDRLYEGKGGFLGKSGVAMLFILSAYLLCELYYWNEQKVSCSWIVNFYKKRVIRIFPPLLFALIAAVILKFMTFHLAIRQFFMLEKYSHFWVLPVELGFYLVFPVILVLMQKTGKYFSVIGSVIMITIWLVYYFIYPQHSQNNLLYCLPLFILGIIVSLISHNKQTVLGGGCIPEDADVFGCIVIVVFECLGSIVYSILAIRDNIVFKLGIMKIDCLEFFRFIVGPLIFAFCLAVIIMQNKIKGILEKTKWLQNFGKISYSFYLIHYIILVRTAKLVKIYSIDRMVALVFVFSLSIVCAYIMYWLLEIQVSKFLRRILKIV